MRISLRTARSLSLREGNLIGNGPQVLSDIDMLGTDFSMGGPGTCGMTPRSPGRAGQPPFVSSMTIGGTAAWESDSNSELFACRFINRHSKLERADRGLYLKRFEH